MIYGLYLSAAGMQVQAHRHDTIANNMANVSTTAFKRDVALFRTREAESATAPGGSRWRQPVLDQLGGGTFVCPTFTEFRQGEADMTGRALDVCIEGPGFLAVRDLDGATRYTRDGRLTVDGTGRLTLADGQRLVLDANGQPIQVDPSRETLVGADGTVTQGGSAVATIGLVDFASPQRLHKIGSNLYDASGAGEGQARGASLVAGALERSTVDPVKELVAMIQAQRAYEANASLIRIQDQTLAHVVNDLSRNL